MPSRKSDTSSARFVLADDDNDSTMATEPAAVPAPSATDEPSAANSTTQQAADKKDKDKERDNLTIEVCRIAAMEHDGQC
jgi:hypothetical protein